MLFSEILSLHSGNLDARADKKTEEKLQELYEEQRRGHQGSGVIREGHQGSSSGVVIKGHISLFAFCQLIPCAGQEPGKLAVFLPCSSCRSAVQTLP